ncbi:hypothetical protein EGM_20532 [Macaca fascicularis]|uniref:Ig-like domain-containing protein n=1 Tax=Macaca fascicularis TaxID=9541 RepID=G8F2F5_MACFA|nr:PREDICTED: uncharacterized protein LOC107129321 isoform X1 [Macaca fascicularis]EHH61469.1 hypothetical protein EGM_20532 [Macaca fascicularis]
METVVTTLPAEGGVGPSPKMLLLLLLLGTAGSGLAAVVSQYPSRVICKRGTSVKIECRCLDFQATTMFWYRQFQTQSLILMATSNEGSGVTYEQGVKQDKFPINHPNLTFSTLTVTNAHPEDSSFYICSARDTAPGRDQRPRQEPPAAAPLPQGGP